MTIHQILSGIIISTMLGCSPVGKVYETEGPDLNTLGSDKMFEFRSDGLYNTYDTTWLVNCKQRTFEHYRIYSPLIFINGQKLIWENYLGYFNYSALTLNKYKDYPHFTNYVGKYVTHNDTIVAKLGITLYGGGMNQKIYTAYFQGVIKNKDTILDWHMIPPYPKANKRLNDNFVFLRTPHMLYFIEGKELLGLDSLYGELLNEQKEIAKTN